MKRFSLLFLALILALSLVLSSLTSCTVWLPDIGGYEQDLPGGSDKSKDHTEKKDYSGDADLPAGGFDLSTVPAYSGKEYAEVNGNIPTFAENEITATSYEHYSALDTLGRCGVACASIGIDLMPTEKREDISSVTPTGWVQARYEALGVNYLYNRAHLIGFQLTGENANEQNLITGTRYMNEAMIPFENMVADYIKETKNHVMYLVDPIFEGGNMVATGVHMMAYSVEDEGDGISFNVFLYNVQPGIAISYQTGESRATGTGPQEEAVIHYIINTNTKKFHRDTCKSLPLANYTDRECTRSALIAEGYSPCGICKP